MKTLAIITLAALAIFAVFPGLDLQVSHFFYDGTHFPYRGSVNPPANLGSLALDYTVRISCILSALICLFVLVYDTTRKFFPAALQDFIDKFRALIKFTHRQLTYFFLVAVITPGILVHWVMKPIWERARPVNTTEFGGEKTYSNFYHLFVGQDGNSFPSGHAAMAFSLVALAFMVRPENRKKVLIITILYACLASMCRVWQGSHFISDVTFSGILTLWTVLLLKKFYLDKQNVNPQSDFA